jgi:hypothetical protein
MNYAQKIQVLMTYDKIITVSDNAIGGPSAAATHMNGLQQVIMLEEDKMLQPLS